MATPNENHPSELAPDGGLPTTACSASSDTPETDSFSDKPAPNGSYSEACREWVEFARKLERQRNAAWKTLKEIRQLFVDDESFGATVDALFAKPLEEAESEIARLQSLLNS
jgi:hypothetical protein